MPQTFGGELNLLQNRLGYDPGLTKVPLYTYCEELFFVYSLAIHSSPQRKNVSLSLTDQKMLNFIQQYLFATFVSIQALQQNIFDFESVLLNKPPSLSKLYSVCSSGENILPTETLTARLNRITTQLRYFELQSSNLSSSFGEFVVNTFHPLRPPFSLKYCN